MNIYVSNLNFDTTSESLKKLFAKFGKITSAKVILDRGTGFSRGFGFVEMPNNTEGREAIDKLNCTEFEGKTINVNIARSKTNRDSNSWNRLNEKGYNKRHY